MTRPQVLLLAPRRTTGGITSWASVLLSEAQDTDFLVEDTSQTYCPPGGRRTLWHRFLGFGGGLRRTARVLRRVRREAADAVFVTCSPGPGFVVRDVPLFLLLRAIRMPVIVVLHGGDIARFFGRSRFRTWFTMLGLRRVDRVIATTRTVEAYLGPFLPTGILCYLPNMVPDDYWSAVDPAGRRPLRPGHRTIALVAWQSPVKGSLSAVSALARLPDDVELLLVGEGSTENEVAIDALIEQVGVGARVTRCGRLARPGVDRILAGCEVSLLPSATEGFPMAVLEAMANAVPVVTSGVGNLPEIVLGDPGRPAGILIAATADDPRYPVPPDELARAIQRLLDDPAEAATLGHNGRERVRISYLASRVLPRLEGLIADVIAARASSGEARPPLSPVGPESGNRQPGGRG